MFHCGQSAIASSGFLAFDGIATFFSDHQTFSLGLLNIFCGQPKFFGCVWCFISINCGGGSIQKQLNDFCGECEWGPFLASSLKYFFKLWKINTLRLPLIFSKSWMVFFFLLLKIPHIISYIQHFPKITMMRSKICFKNLLSLQNILCKLNWKGFQDKFANYSRQAFCLQLKRSLAKFSLQRIEPAGNFWQFLPAEVTGQGFDAKEGINPWLASWQANPTLTKPAGDESLRNQQKEGGINS